MLKRFILAILYILVLASCKKKNEIFIQIQNNNTTGQDQPWRFIKINGVEKGAISPNETQHFTAENIMTKEGVDITISFKHPDVDSVYHDSIIYFDHEGQTKIFQIPF